MSRLNTSLHPMNTLCPPQYPAQQKVLLNRQYSSSHTFSPSLVFSTTRLNIHVTIRVNKPVKSRMTSQLTRGKSASLVKRPREAMKLSNLWGFHAKCVKRAKHAEWSVAQRNAYTCLLVTQVPAARGVFLSYDLTHDWTRAFPFRLYLHAAAVIYQMKLVTQIAS